jgi:tetratricopeptide (TPR) repeat protein
LAAHCASGCDTIARARYWLDQAQPIAAGLHDRLLQARVWGADAWLALDVGDHARALDSADRSLALADGDTDVELAALRVSAETALACGNLDRAEHLAHQALGRAASSTAPDALLARSTLGWCLVERGRYRQAVAHARLLRTDSYHDQSEPSETSVEAELIAIAADPAIEPHEPLLGDQRFSWWTRLEQRLRLAARTSTDGWEAVLHTAADVAVLADQVPLAHPRLGAMILLGDAALTGGDRQQAYRAYEQALRDAARAPAPLRAADALDGIALLTQTASQQRLSTAAAAASAAIRQHADAVAWPRPSLPAARHLARSSRPPAGWICDGQLTTTAVNELTKALWPMDRAADSWSNLTHAERQVAQLVGAGLTNAGLSDKRCVRPGGF